MSGFHLWLQWIGQASFQLLIAAAIASLLCLTIARKSPRLKHAIWVIVLLKCFIPPATTAPWSLAQFWTPAATVVPILGQATPDANTPTDGFPIGQSLPDAATSDQTTATTSQPVKLQPLAETVVPSAIQATPDATAGFPSTSTTSQPTSLQPPTETVVSARREAMTDAPIEPVAAVVDRITREQTGPRERSVPPAEAFHQWWSQLIGLSSLLIVWAAGTLISLMIAAVSLMRVAAKIRQGQTIDEGPAAIALEEAALAVGLKSTPRLVSIDESMTPFVAGLFRPTIVIPQSILDSLPADELRLVVWHEVVHIDRRDAWTSLLQLFSVALFWFHPAVWWAAASIRREREACCDETVLRTSLAEPSTYGDAFLHVLSAVRGRAMALPAWAAPAGVFERNSDLRTRLEQIMNSQPNRSRRLQTALVATLFALLVIPMGTRASDPWANTPEEDIPQIVSIEPASGTADVDPETTSITVTFDRPMDHGYSWTGGGPTFPRVPDGAKPSWSKDKKACTLPVELDAGKFYRLGINSKSFRNFQSEAGVPVKPSVLTFTTKGASTIIVDRMDAPKIVAIDPPNGATNVNPLTTREIRVTFDRPMNKGMSWVRTGETFPSIKGGTITHWMKNSRTCVSRVELEPNRTYQLSFNSDRFKNFQSTEGVPLTPVEYSFRTGAERAPSSPAHFDYGSVEELTDWWQPQLFRLRDQFRGSPDEQPVGHLGWSPRKESEPATVRLRISNRSGVIQGLKTLDPTIKFMTEPRVDEPRDWVQLESRRLELPEGVSKLNVRAMIRAVSVQEAAIRLLFFNQNIDHKGNTYQRSVQVPIGQVTGHVSTKSPIEVGNGGQPDIPFATHEWATYSGEADVPDNAVSYAIQLALDRGKSIEFANLEISPVRSSRETDAVHSEPPAPLGQATPGDDPSKPIVPAADRATTASSSNPTNAPRIISIDPPNGAADVHPLTTKEIRITFDRPMADGMSWVGGGESFPRQRIGAPEHWLSNNRTCVMPLDLDYEHAYQVQLNSDSDNGFQSTTGVPLAPYRYSFSTVSKNAAMTLLSTSFEQRFAGPNDPNGDYQDHLRNDEDASDGEISLRLTKLDNPVYWPKDADPTNDVRVIHSGLNYTHTQLLPIPNGSSKLEVAAMIKAEKTDRARAKLSFFEYTPSAKAGKEESYFQVSPPGVDDDDDPSIQAFFVGRLNARDPVADHDWALYRGTVDIPERAELVQLKVELEAGDALWLDELSVKAIRDSSILEEPSADETVDNSEVRPPSINPVTFVDDKGLLFADDLNWSLDNPGYWKANDVQGVVLQHRTDIGSPASPDTSSLELRKNIEGYFPIASWSRRLDHNDPTATHVQLTANVKAENARKAVLDVLFLDENGEWIHHQWADHIGDYRNEWLNGEGRLPEGTNTTPKPNGVTHDWKQYGGAVAIPPDTKFIEVSAQIYGPGTVFVDDVDVRYVSQPDDQPIAK